MLKIVILDTNVLVSYICFFNGRQIDEVVEYCLDNCKVLISKETLEELRQTLLRDKFDKFSDKEERWLVLQSIEIVFEHISIKHKIENSTICRDPKDVKFLELALNGEADYLITGDKDLLVLEKFENTQIISPIEFLKIIK